MRGGVCGGGCSLLGRGRSRIRCGREEWRNLKRGLVCLFQPHFCMTCKGKEEGGGKSNGAASEELKRLSVCALTVHLIVHDHASLGNHDERPKEGIDGSRQ